jgi:hypothetical protein
VRAAALFVVLLLGCAKGGDPGVHPPSREIAFPDPVPLTYGEVPGVAQGTVVTLLDPGRAPRTALRYGSTPGARGLVRAKHSVDIGIGSLDDATAEVAQGKFTLTFLLEHTVISADGAKLLVDGVARDLVFEPLDETARIMMRMPTFVVPKEPRITATMTQDGGIVHADAGMSMAAQYINPRGLTIPFPHEPIGVGARWRVTQTYESPFDFVEEAVVELHTFDGKRARVSSRSTWHQPRRRYRGLEGDMTMRFEGDAEWQEAVLVVGGPPLVESGHATFTIRAPLEGTRGVLKVSASSVLSVP